MSKVLPITIRHSDSRLLGHHRQLMRRHRPEVDWSGFDRRTFDPGILEQMATSWQSRLFNEYRSANMGAQFLNLLLLAGVPVDLSGVMSRIVQDEIRHACLCAEVVTAMGQEPRSGGPEESFWLTIDPQEPLMPQVLDWTLYLFCCCETLSFNMLDRTLAVAEAPGVDEVLRRIVSDERLHREFGWQVMETLLPDVDDETFLFLEGQLFTHFDNLEAAFTDYGPEGDRQEGLDDQRKLGSLSILEHRDGFHSAVESDLLPRLEALGFDARRIWRDRANQIVLTVSPAREGSFMAAHSTACP